MIARTHLTPELLGGNKEDIMLHQKTAAASHYAAGLPMQFNKRDLEYR
jgi:hypothetical protein